MNYSLDGFEAIVAAIEASGGAYTEDYHLSEPVIFTGCQKQIPDTETCGCSKPALAVLTYDPMLAKPPSGSGFVQVCIVCDSVGAFPRFEADVREADPDYWDALEWEDPEDEIDPDDADEVE